MTGVCLVFGSYKILVLGYYVTLKENFSLKHIKHDYIEI